MLLIPSTVKTEAADSPETLVTNYKGVITQKTATFTAVKTSNLTQI
jgi:hypothetical protein